jgi:hypothetical protein
MLNCEKCGKETKSVMGGKFGEIKIKGWCKECWVALDKILDVRMGND